MASSMRKMMAARDMWPATRLQRRVAHVPRSMAERLAMLATEHQTSISALIGSYCDAYLRAPQIPVPDVPPPHDALIAVHLPIALDRKLRALARRHGWSLSALIRGIVLLELLSSSPSEPPGGEGS
jgi:hypothetical protein